MSRHLYPSDRYPSVPTVSVECPNDWEPVPASGVLMAAAAPEVPGEFRPNIVVTWARLAADYTVERAFDDMIERYRVDKPDLEVVGTRETEVCGHPAMLCEVTFGSDDAGTLVQTSLALVVANGAVRDLMWVCGTCSATQIESALGTLRGALGTVTVAE